MKNKEAYHAFGIFLFVVFSSYLTININYHDNNYYYFFFKARNYYSTVEKFIIPITFWVAATILLILPNIFKLTRYPAFDLLLVIRNSLLFHLFLLLICFSNEYLQENFSLTSISGKSFPGLWLYQGITTTVFFIGYYFLAIDKAIACFRNRINLVDLIFPFSILMPFVFADPKIVHLAFIGFSLLIRLHKNKFTAYGLFENQWFAPCSIFLLSLKTRLMYAWYFSSFGLDSIGFGADGPSYFKSAVAFSDFNYFNVNFFYAPAYTFYLSCLISLFGKTPETIFYGQAVISSFIPVIIYFITNKIFGNKISIFSGVFVSLSHLCIHYSVVINRASLMALIIPLLIFCCIKIKDNIKASFFLAFGFLTGTAYYVGQECLLLLLFLIGYFFALSKKYISRTNKILSYSSFFLGIILAWAPINYAYYKITGNFLISGRALNFYNDTFTHNGNRFSMEMVQLGFDPVNNPAYSFKQILKNPFEILFLCFGKIISELPGFFFDPGGEWFKPIGLSNGTFFDAVLAFYICCLLVCGIVCLTFEKSIPIKYKILIMAPVLLYSIFSTFVIMGTFRFRAVISPLNQIFLAIAVSRLFGLGRIKHSDETQIFWSISINKLNLLRKRWISYYGTSLSILFVIIGVLAQRSDIINFDKSNFEVTNWPSNLLNNQVAMSQGMAKNIRLKMNYQVKSLKKSARIHSLSFNLCRYLFPMLNPEYQIILDEVPLNYPKQIPQGCHKFSEKIVLLKNKGTIEILLSKVSPKTNFPSGPLRADTSEMWFITNLFFNIFFKQDHKFLKELTLLKIGKPDITEF